MVLLLAEQYCFGSCCLPFGMNLKRILTAAVDFVFFLTYCFFSKISFITYPSLSCLLLFIYAGLIVMAQYIF